MLGSRLDVGNSQLFSHLLKIFTAKVRPMVRLDRSQPFNFSKKKKKKKIRAPTISLDEMLLEAITSGNLEEEHIVN